MLVSILIANHDYGRFLADALDSALGQTHSAVEVVVVDDGSTDESPEVVRSYGDAVVARFQAHCGQAAALNAAFVHSSGDVVCLLDADDTFHPEKAAEVVSALRRRPDACLVHHQMQTVDADGTARDQPWPRQIRDGNLARRVQRSAGWYPRAPASGLSFRRGYLERLLPIPTEPRLGRGSLGPVQVELKADTYLASPAAFVGTVAGIRRPLTQYRIHGANKSGAGSYDGEAARSAACNRRMAQYCVELEALRDVLARCFGQRPDLWLEDHLQYQLLRCALGETSRPAAVARTVASPGLPWRMKPREAARVALGRGPSAPVEVGG